MALAHLFWTVDAAIGALPGPLANLAAGLLVAALATAHAYLATGHWIKPDRPHTRGDTP